MTTNTHIAAQSAKPSWNVNFIDRGWTTAVVEVRINDKLIGQFNSCDSLSHVLPRVLAAALASWAAPALDAQGEIGIPDGFVLVPAQVLRNASDSLGSFVSDHGWSQADMDAMDVLDAYLAGNPAAPPPPAVGKPLSDYEIDALLLEEHAGDSEMHEFAHQVLALFCKINGIVTKDTGT